MTDDIKSPDGEIGKAATSEIEGSVENGVERRAQKRYKMRAVLYYICHLDPVKNFV